MTITNGYATLADVAAKMGISTAGTYDTAIEQAVEAASRQIDDYTGRRFWQDSTVQTREFYADDPSELRSVAGAVMDISTTTGLVVKIDSDDNGTYATTLTVGTHFVVTPLNAADDGEPFTGIRLVDSVYTFPMSSSGRPGVQVTAQFGWAAVPDPVVQACIVQSVLLFKAADAAMGGLSFGDGSFMRVRGGLNPVASTLIERYAFPRIA
jgi:hypothetical protein